MKQSTIMNIKNNQYYRSNKLLKMYKQRMKLGIVCMFNHQYQHNILKDNSINSSFNIKNNQYYNLYMQLKIIMYMKNNTNGIQHILKYKYQHIFQQDKKSNKKMQRINNILHYMFSKLKLKYKLNIQHHIKYKKLNLNNILKDNQMNKY